MNVVLALVLLSLLILVHELGHFFAAKFFGVDVEEFGIGLPPKAKTLFKKGGTEFTLNWLPIGGFVRLFGEEHETIVNPTRKKRAFFSQKIWKRALILVAGVFSNIVLGILIFSFVYSVRGVPKTVGENVVVVEIADGSPSDLAGLEPGDVFVSVGDENVSNVDSFIAVVDVRKEESVRFLVSEINPDGSLSDTSRQVAMIPRLDPPEGEGSLGVSITSVPSVVYERKPWYTAPFYGVVEGVKESYLWGRAILQGIFSTFSSIFQGRIPSDVAGPVGVVRVTGEVAELGVLALAHFLAILSINLGLFNLLPIPALDGGRLLFVGFEAIFGKKKIRKIEGWVHTAGFVFLIGLMILLTWQDIVG